ncbi:MAG: RagB/SusD family nutrient uptake outer membrane protein [Bacteroidales bacterium]|nr:RagB/SusD family nutrient uptake outer membrane protein [Bacteroidales bacterium]
MKKMKIINLWVMIGMLVSCNDFMEPYPNGGYTTDDIWDYQAMVQGLIGECYESSYLPRNYNNNEGTYLDGATDDAVITSTTHNIRRLAVGALPSSSDPFLTYWDRGYKGIFLVNTFLKDRNGYHTRFMVDEHKNNLIRTRLQGEAFALRAWFLWDLLQKFGGKGMNGEMLGVPILLEPVDMEEAEGLTRNTYDECVQQILSDCDSAFKYLPIAHRDFLVTDDADKALAGSRYWGRFDGITTRAIKANVYLTWASPRFNPGNIAARWDSAAVNAKKVMDFKENVDGIVANGFNKSTGVNWVNPNFPGIVFTSRYNNANDAMEKMFYPGGFQGNGNIGATQDLVDAFPMSNGYPKDHPLGAALYDPQNPYANRDPRFYSIIFHNQAQAKKNNTGAVMYTFENWDGAKDAPGPINNSRTNYHIKKFVFMGLNWSENNPNKQPHSKFFIRWAHMCLAFAEAANHVAGPTDASKYGISAKDAIAYLRSRKTYDNADGFLSDPYLDEVAGQGKDAFNEFIRNERRLETCFEGIRFFDLRRWSTDVETLNKPVHMAKITRNTDDTFTYDLGQEVESRVFRSAYLPIPYQEMLRMGNLIQNEGWDNWK